MNPSLQSESIKEENCPVRFRLTSSQKQGQEPAVEQSYLYHGTLRFDKSTRTFQLSYTEKDELGKGEVTLTLREATALALRQEAIFARSGNSQLELQLKCDQKIRQAKYHSEYGLLHLSYLTQKVEHEPDTGTILLQYELFPKTPDALKMRIAIKYKKM